jgi:hypothetical protein
VYDLFKTFIKRSQNKFDTTIKKVRSDNGSEFKNTKIDELCDDFGIGHQFSPKYTPQSNGIVERKNRTLIDMARSMLSEYNVSHSFWAKAINTACYYINRLYCHGMLEKTPYELLNGRKPNIAFFRVFGCKCYILKKGTKLRKFEKKCDEGFLLGYSTTSKAYRMWNLASGTLEEVHDVEFDETQGSQDKVENLDDVRGNDLASAMKNIEIGDIRPRQVNDGEDSGMINSSVEVGANEASSSVSHDQSQMQHEVQDQQDITSQVNDQVSILQPVSIARDHPLDQIIGGIQSGVQTRSRLASFVSTIHLSHQPRLKKH